MHFLLKCTWNIFRIYHIAVLSGIFSEKNWKIDKYAEIKQHAPEKPVGRRRNQKPENIMRQMKMKYNILKLQDIAIAILRGKFIMINVYVKKKDLTQTNFTLEGTRKKSY